MTAQSKKTISYIFPIYNEEGNINLLYEAITKVAQELTADYDLEFVFINDGSRDKSLSILEQIASKDKRVVLIDFARNFGHQIAVTAGIDYACGDALIVMDSDMQDPPAVSTELIRKWEEGYDVVYAQRQSRKDTAFKKITANIYYRVLGYLSDVDIPRNTGDFRLIDRRIADEIKNMHESNRFLRGMISWVGGKQTAVQFDRDERHAGKTGYPLKKMIRFAVDGIMGFSNVPLKLIARTGYIFAFFAFIGTLYALAVKLFYPDIVVSGWTFIVIVSFLIGGVQLIMLGVLGNYIGRIYVEAQARPLYVVRSVLRNEKKEE